MINPEKYKKLKDKMNSLGISGREIEEKFVLPSSKGGQKADKTSCAVFLKHIPTGITASCGAARERETNRFLARRTLAEKIEEKLSGTSSRLREIEKKKKQKRKRKKRAANKYGSGATKPGSL